MGRLFSSMLNKKIRSIVSQHLRQKGFMSEDGCKNNITILSKAIANIKANVCGIVTIVDISKAFDTVSHAMLGERLKVISATMSRYFQKMYNDVTTTKNCRGKNTVTVDLLRGVKQGGLLSLLLFNLALEPIVSQIDGSILI